MKTVCSGYGGKRSVWTPQQQLLSLPMSLPPLPHCRIQTPQLEGFNPSLPSAPLPSLCFPPLLSTPLPLEVGPLNTAKGPGGALF